MLLIIRHFSFFSFILFVLVSLNIAFSHQAEKQENMHYHVFHIPLSSKPNCSAHKTGLGPHKMKLSHAYSPCSPFANSVKVPSLNEILQKNKDRVKGLNSKSNLYATMDASDEKSVEHAPSLDGAEFLTTIGLGTPKVEYKVMIDTGSDPTWVRCKPCQEGCTTTLSPLLDPLKSSTYKNGSNDFNVEYGDGSSTKGSWIYDTLTIDEPSHVIRGFKFGCGQHNVDGLDDFAHAAGVLGLGRGVDSLVSQSASGIFGYCLPQSGYTTGYLLFGDDAKKSSSSSTLQFTDLLPGPRGKDSLYFLELVGISVGGKRLNVSSSVFTSVGTIIDSGTVVTHLPKEAYNALSSAFRQSMSTYQRASPQEVLDTCFSVKSGQRIVIPSVTFHFAGGADVALDQYGIGLTVEKESKWCLGFTASEKDDLTIIGSTQQRGMEVLYDIQAGKIGFGQKRCGN